jgi:adenylosuccinate synthase
VGDLLDKSFTTSYIRLRLKHQRLLDNFNFQEDISAWEEEFFEAIEFLKTLNIVDGEYFINDKIAAAKKYLRKGPREVCSILILELFPSLPHQIPFPRAFAQAWE